jgi:hypothetical protein
MFSQHLDRRFALKVWLPHFRQFHHAIDATFMTYRVTGIYIASGEPIEHIGVERYTFCDGRIAEKGVLSCPDLQAAA